ncbi:putative F-box protein [Cardamine amara subsp. amara]|uniref:F-box protein n=1 Tax=Cardamine amara subsp. amara TaxID=228776 RepID=A0ABD1APU0_CARAN
MVDEENAVSFKKGDNSWKQIPELSLSGIEECFNMVYKDHKLYCLNFYKLKIFDFSGEIPVQVFKISVRGYIQMLEGFMRLPGIPLKDQMAHHKDDLVVTVGGDVLIVKSVRPSMSKIWNFQIYKMGSSKGKKWEEIVSLGDEAILLDLGITVLAKDVEGMKKNSIYFNATDYYDEHDRNIVFIYSLNTKTFEQPHQFVCSSIPCSNALWFLPSF